MRRLPLLLAACLALVAALAGRAMALDLPEIWPEPGAAPGTPVRFPSLSPFTPAQAADARPTTGVGTLFMPEPARDRRPVPAVVLLHGSGGVLAARELAYARQLAGLGVAALAVDSFASRRDIATGYVDRLLAITESMLAADAYAALAWLSSRPDIDPSRVALVGFSYGGLASLYAVNAGVADRLARGPHRFAGHASYYGPCIGEFAVPRTTGAPVLMQAGALDETIDVERCRATADAFRRGGSDTRLVIHEGAYHQWDGAPGADWRPSRGIRACRFRVEADGNVRDLRTRVAMTGRATRTLALGLCTDGDGYQIRSNPAVRARSTAELARFLNRVLGPESPRPADG
jgi:dienelactone hydrolase